MLEIIAELKSLSPDSAESRLLIERDRARILLPDREPEYIGAPRLGLLDARCHQRGACSRPMKRTVDVDAVDLGWVSCLYRGGVAAANQHRVADQGAVLTS